MTSAYVTVYHDPGTRQKPEGKALLVSRGGPAGFYEGVELERWDVRFLVDGKFGEVVERTVVKPGVR